MRNIRSNFIQVDEMHGFVQVRQKNLNPTRHGEITMGERYVFIAIDSETKLIPSFVVGKRNQENACWLTKDLESRLTGRVQSPDSYNVTRNPCYGGKSRRSDVGNERIPGMK
jgi:hypothetical protein